MQGRHTTGKLCYAGLGVRIRLRRDTPPPDDYTPFGSETSAFVEPAAKCNGQQGERLN